MATGAASWTKCSVTFSLSRRYGKVFYTAYYAAVQHSPVHAEFCRRVFGRDLCQHGFADKEHFAKETLHPDRTPLAEALKANGLIFCTWDLTRQDYELAQRRKRVLAELEPQFAAEGLGFIYENRMGDANGVCQAVEEGLHARYLYQACPSDAPLSSKIVNSRPLGCPLAELEHGHYFVGAAAAPNKRLLAGMLALSKRTIGSHDDGHRRRPQGEYKVSLAV